MRSLVFALACGISFLLYLHRYTWGFVKKDVRDEFGWDPPTLGWLDGLFGISYGVGQIPAGAVCDWCGARVLLGASILSWSLALATVALATGLISMAIGRVVFGVAQAGCYPALNKVSKNWFAASGRTTAQGWIATFFGRMGGALSFIVFGSVMLGWLHLSWRWALGIFTLLGLACGLLFLILFRNTPREHPWANAAESDLILAGDPAAATATRSRLDWARTLSRGSVWFLFVRAFASNVADVLYVYWVPMFLSDVKHLGHANTGWLAALPLIGGALGGMTSGWLQSALIRRTGRRRWARRGAGLIGKLIAAVVMLLSLTVEDGVLIACLFLVVKFFSDWEQPAEWGTISDIAGHSAATLFATVNTVGAIGGFVAGPLTGLILQRFSSGEQVTAAGWNALFVCISLEYLLAASAWLFINADKPIDPRPGALSR